MLIDVNGSSMTEDSTPAPSPEQGCATSDTPAVGGSIGEASLDLNITDFCTRHSCVPSSEAADWFGFGTVSTLFNSLAGGYWMPLTEAHKVTGLDWREIKAMFDEDYETDTGDADKLMWRADSRTIRGINLVQHSFVMRAMLAGPWHREFMDNTMNLFRHAALRTGLADAIGPVIVIRDGQATAETASLADVITAGDPLPSEGEAREQAMRGPAGAL
jgi:hypothetical protein